MYRNQDINRIFSDSHFRDFKQRSLINWVEKGLIQPALEPENQGGRREYSYRNLIEIAILLELQNLMQTPTRFMKWVMHDHEVKTRLGKGDFDFFIAVPRQAKGGGKVWSEGLRCLSLPDVRKLFDNGFASLLLINVAYLKELVDSAL